MQYRLAPFVAMRNTLNKIRFKTMYILLDLKVVNKLNMEIIKLSSVRNARKTVFTNTSFSISTNYLTKLFYSKCKILKIVLFKKEKYRLVSFKTHRLLFNKRKI